MENDNPLAFLDAPVQDNTPAPAPDAPAPQEAAPSAPDRARNADGTFAAKPEEAAPAAPEAPDGEAKPPAALSEKEIVGFYGAMQKERDRRQAAERELADLRARQAPAPTLTPDEQAVFADYQRSFSISRKFAVKDLGAEGVDELQAWAKAKCDADPAFNAKMLSSDDPFEDARAARDAERVLGKFKASDLADYDDYAAWKAAKAAAQASPATAADDSPPRSLANAPGTGSRGGKPPVDTGDAAAFKGVFGGNP